MSNMSLRDRLRGLQLPELKEQLKNFDNVIISGNKEILVERLAYLIERERELVVNPNPYHVDIQAVITYAELLEQRKIFKQPEEDTWLDVDQLLTLDEQPIPPEFDMLKVHEFLSMSEVTLNGKPYKVKIGKPVRNGRTMYLSKCIKRAWFTKTIDDKYLLFRCNMAASMKKDRR